MEQFIRMLMAPTHCFHPTFNPQALHKLADEKDRMPVFQIDHDKRLKE